MAYRPILTLDLSHDYYGSDDLPLEVVPSDAPAFAKAGLLLRQLKNRVQVLSGDPDADPVRVVLDVLATSPDAFRVTKGADWDNVVMFDHVDDAFEFDADLAAARIPQMPAKRLARLSFDLVAGQPRNCTVHFDTVESLWAYHVTGGQNADELEVVDTKSLTTFSAMGAVTLPDGRQAFVIRSDDPLPARARPDQKFALQRPSAFGPEILVPVLPAAGISFKPIAQKPGSAARLQSDIYVSLW